MAELVEHQGLVVEKEGDAVALHDQGVVVKTEAGRFATLGTDGNWHGYVPSTQVRDILNGEGQTLEGDDAAPFRPLEAMADAKDVDVVGSEAAAPTGAIDDFSPGGGRGNEVTSIETVDQGGSTTTTIADSSGEHTATDSTGGNVGASSDRPLTDVDPSLAPATKDELDRGGASGATSRGKRSSS